ncbi:BamA/TamA family outer membrane protein [candidate division GN15 bacterium]|nr:BamA/TamA family outer membrane protein [candidate division GN15 bacterium]
MVCETRGYQEVAEIWRLQRKHTVITRYRHAYQTGRHRSGLDRCLLPVLLASVLMIVLLPIFTETAWAQYFGRNKIQYEQFDFEVTKTEHIDVYHYAQERTAAVDAARMAERWNARFERIFNHELHGRQPLILYANHPDFQQTNVIPGQVSQGVGGVTEGLKRRVVLPLSGAYSGSNHVIGHELVHAFQYSIAAGEESNRRRGISAPLWFIEGMSEYLSIGREYTLTSMWLRDAVLHDDLPTLEDLSSKPRYFPYRWGHAFWIYTASEYGDQVVPDLYRMVLRTGWKEAFEKGLDISTDSLSTLWQASIREQFSGQIDGRTHPDSVGQSLLQDQSGPVLSPSISPDGRYVAFLGQRDLFSIDLYLADVETGEVVGELASSGTDAHFDAIQFMDASGTWSPDSKQFAFVVIDNGDHAVAIVDVETQELVRTLDLKKLTAITHLAWSPDGSRLALSARPGGISDLFLYNLETDSLRRLTRNKFAELQPAWSPGGSRIAFVTEGGGRSDMETLDFGKMQIGVIDVNTLNIRYVSVADDTRHTNPGFGPDGSSLYMIADPEGFADIYRYDLSEQSFAQITNVSTGVSGLTSLSPAMSVAADTQLIVCTVFDSAQYRLRLLTPEEINQQRGPLATAGDAAVTKDESGMSHTADTSSVVSLLERPLYGLDDASTFAREDYAPNFSLVYAGQSTIGVAVDRFGTSLGGGANFLWSDILGHQEIGLVVQSSGGLADLGGQVSYRNLRDRWNWGGAVGHVPYLTGRVLTSIDTVLVNGDPVEVLRRDLIRRRVFIERASLFAEYPLSENRRFEFTGGGSYISYDSERETIFSRGGVILASETEDIEAPDALALAHASAAYVGDFSFFGFTSPIAGSRYRFGVEPTAGSLNYLTLLADYRQYLFANPFTFAFRGLHVGRYLGDSEDERLSELYLGFETLVRGYSVGSIELEECTGEGGNCPEYDRLVGSRIGVLNAEIRFPLLGTSQFGMINFPYLPTEFLAFADAGVAWTQNESVEFTFEKRSPERIPVFSAGAAVRINLLGFLVGQIYYAVPFQRPGSDGEFGFVIAPGW